MRQQKTIQRDDGRKGVLHPKDEEDIPTFDIQKPVAPLVPPEGAPSLIKLSQSPEASRILHSIDSIVKYNRLEGHLFVRKGIARPGHGFYNKSEDEFVEYDKSSYPTRSALAANNALLAAANKINGRDDLAMNLVYAVEHNTKAYRGDVILYRATPGTTARVTIQANLCMAIAKMAMGAEWMGFLTEGIEKEKGFWTVRDGCRLPIEKSRDHPVYARNMALLAFIYSHIKERQEEAISLINTIEGRIGFIDINGKNLVNYIYTTPGPKLLPQQPRTRLEDNAALAIAYFSNGMEEKGDRTMAAVENMFTKNGTYNLRISELDDEIYKTFDNLLLAMAYMAKAYCRSEANNAKR